MRTKRLKGPQLPGALTGPERESTGSSAARGADNSTEHPIPEQLLQLFKRIPQSDGGTCPAYVSLTQREQDFMGENMGLRAELWRHLVKTPVLALPQTDICKYWMDWACATQQLPYGAGCMLMNPNTYEADLRDFNEILTHHGPHTASQQEVHIRHKGLWISNGSLALDCGTGL